jgi:anti-sigma regulatory factor (Ser/Thr protein kinase)
VPARTATVTSPPRSRQGPPGQAPARLPRAFLDLGAVLTAPGCARAWTREILSEWGAADLADTAELVASELVTNSVTHSAGPDQAVIRLVLTLDQGELAILVRDDNPGIPVAGQPGDDDEDGRGLLMVEQVSDRCGWYPLEGAKPAKVTWALFHQQASPAANCPEGRRRAVARLPVPAAGRGPPEGCRSGRARRRPRPRG